MTVRASDGWTKTVTPRVTAGRGSQNRDPACDRAWARGVSHNRDPACATRIAEISTLRLYCPLLNNNAPAPVPAPLGPDMGPGIIKSRPGVNWPAFVPVSCPKGWFPIEPRIRGIAALIVARLFQASSEAAVPPSRVRGFLLGWVQRPRGTRRRRWISVKGAAVGAT